MPSLQRVSGRNFINHTRDRPSARGQFLTSQRNTFCSLNGPIFATRFANLCPRWTSTFSVPGSNTCSKIVSTLVSLKFYAYYTGQHRPIQRCLLLKGQYVACLAACVVTPFLKNSIICFCCPFFGNSIAGVGLPFFLVPRCIYDVLQTSPV